VRRRRTLLPGLLATALSAIALSLPAAPAAAATRCPATFHVLHSDHVGAMSLPAGMYTISVGGGLGCTSASTLLTGFLQDYDGILAFPWKGDAAARSFTRGSGPAGFSLRRGSYPPTPPTPPTPSKPVTCPGSFSVLHDDSIGPLAFPKGAYQLKLLGPKLGCQGAAQWFAQFLDDPNGRLPSPWTIADPPGTTAGEIFANGPGRASFSALRTNSSTSGGGHAPDGEVQCPGTFQVLHNDHVGSLYLPKGPYEVAVLSGASLSCAQASQQLARFLAAIVMPAPWVLDAATATFTRGIGSSTGFRIKPARVGVIR
jgi:hypothetical protein